MARKKKRKKKKPRLPKVNLQTPRSQIRPIQMRGPRHYMKNAREYPIMGCWAVDDWQNRGVTPVVVARKQSESKVIFGSCMVDLWCLGIKDAYGNGDFSRNKFERNLPMMCANKPLEISVELAHEIIYGAMEYADRYGFKPHRDFTFQLVDKILDPPDLHPRTHGVEFGKDGMPFYFHGPHDDEAMQKRVVRTLERTAGEGNFHFVVGAGPPPDFFDDDW